MPLSYTLHPSLDLVATRFVGVVTDDEFIALYRALFEDEGYRPGMNELADLRQVTSLDLSVAALRRVEYHTRMRYGPDGPAFRSALIAPGDLAYAIGRMYEIFATAGPEQVGVFRTADEAFACLGLDPMSPDRLHGTG